jgi:hypothetical protein
MPKAIKAIKLIGNLSNKNNYQYSSEQIKIIIKDLKKSLKNLKKRFY